MDVHDDRPGRALLDVRVNGEQLPNEATVMECRPSTGLPRRAHVRTALMPHGHEMVGAQRDPLRAFRAAAVRGLDVPATPLEFTVCGDTSRDNSRVLPDRTRRQCAERLATWSSLLGAEGHEGGSLPLGRLLDTRYAFTARPGQYSLIDMVHPVGAGTETSHSRAWCACAVGSGTRPYSWACRGRGAQPPAHFYEPRTGPLAESWYSQANAARVRRTRQPVERTGTSATGIALDWTSSQPVPVVALIGSRQPEEVRDPLAVAAHRLTAADRDWPEAEEEVLPPR
ncbi:hypothetical protein GCM10010371_53060 [Streptomyces subrutilus]|uniref:Uncharacterized protein n=1 Tax=Streptomyces subrutilus TaxID=36818 RepID=A0A5P2UH50_9ACTN|nr:hypothetical protein [Streptomyces subrutilus]QEU77091.1 hypothetical protein CP968_01100 [Streptomyces subrutilus]GGZ86489.1 hypothetical protein GCM10010371_53060 [Streptomyces subrutilus]